jgi:hypothetical protein
MGTGNGEEQKYGSDHQDENQKDKQTICLNTAVNNAGRGLGANNIGSGNLGDTGSGNLGDTGSGNLGDTGSGNLGDTGSGNSDVR